MQGAEETLKIRFTSAKLGHDAIMLTINTSKAIGKCWANGETKKSDQLYAYSIPHSNLFVSPLISINYTRSHCHRRLHSSGLWKCSIQHCNLSRILNRGALKRQLCQSCVSASSDDEYRSSRNIAISLLKRYRNVIDRGGGGNLKEFISAGVNAYALGCTDEGLKKELIDIKDSGVEIEGKQTYGGSTSLKSKILSEEVDECILWLSIIFITILCTPQPTVIRWSSTPPITDEVRLHWKGFCALIANAYYVRGMAWLPVKTLQLEQMAVVGYTEEPSVVACRMRLVFSTLEVVSPQWPRA